MRLGVDIVEVRRIAAMVSRWGDIFLLRVYTEAELRSAAGRATSLASRFAAKEAAAKALGCGIGQVGWREIEVISLPGGQPALALHGEAGALAGRLGISEMAVSLSDTSEQALAAVVLS
jgi:holo-[acyl-carrier protein] synthase